MEWESPRAAGRSDNSHVQHVLEFILGMRGRAEQGRPRVRMWWATLCLTVVCLVVGLVMSGYSLRIFVKGVVGKEA